MAGTSFDDWRRRLVQDRHWPILIAHGRANESRGKFCGGAERGRVRARGVRSAGIARMDWRRACNGQGGHSGTCWLPARWNRTRTDRLHRAGSQQVRSEEHTSELQSLMRSSYAVFCLKKKKTSNAKENYKELTQKNKQY